MTDNEKKAREIAVSIMSEGHIDKNEMCQRRDLERAAMEMAKYKDAQHRTPSDDTTEDIVHQVIGEVACHETDLQRQIEQGSAFAEHNKTVFEVAMAVAASYLEDVEGKRARLKRLNEENDELRKVNDKLRFSLSEREKEIERLKDEHKKEMDEYRAVYFRQNKILVEQNNALKRQLNESNRQIEIYAKKVRNLEAELEEDGGLG